MEYENKNNGLCSFTDNTDFLFGEYDSRCWLHTQPYDNT